VALVSVRIRSMEQADLPAVGILAVRVVSAHYEYDRSR
jgi:hypothetical protein